MSEIIEGLISQVHKPHARKVKIEKTLERELDKLLSLPADLPNMDQKVKETVNYCKTKYRKWKSRHFHIERKLIEKEINQRVRQVLRHTTEEIAQAAG